VFVLENNYLVTQGLATSVLSGANTLVKNKTKFTPTPKMERVGAVRLRMLGISTFLLGKKKNKNSRDDQIKFFFLLDTFF
jgi:hypothetical protein